jgi:hypothetical protein
MIARAQDRFIALVELVCGKQLSCRDHPQQFKMPREVRRISPGKVFTENV